MEAKLIQIHPQNPEERKIKEVVECLKAGGLIVFPTDTIYAIGCDLLNKRAIEKVGKIKSNKPEKFHLSIICEEMSQIALFAKNLSTPTFKLMKSLLPGPYSFILQANSNIPKLFDSKKKTVGIRMPSNKIAVVIVKFLGNPLVTTSIKNHDKILEYSTDPEQIFEEYKNIVDIIIDGGSGGNKPSTVIDCTGEEPTLVRLGLGVWS